MPPRKGEKLAGQGLKRLLSDKPSQFLLYAVEEAAEKADHMRIARVLKHLKKRYEAVGWVHVSDLLNDCDRYLAARLLGYQFKEEAFGSKLYRIFENGHMMHIRWQNYFLSLPKEYSVSISRIIQIWPVIGEADLTVTHPTHGKVVVELKSINDNGFKKLKREGAQVRHIQQVSHYAHLFTKLEADGPEPWTSQLWYENKNDQNVETFDPEVQAEWVESRLDRLMEIVDLVTSGRLPKSCKGDECVYDDRVGNIKGGDKHEARISETKEWYHQWQEQQALKKTKHPSSSRSSQTMVKSAG